MLIAGRLEQAAVLAGIVAAASVGFERLDPSLPLTIDFRLTNLRLVLVLTLALWLLARGFARRAPVAPRVVLIPATAWLAWMVISAALAPTHQTQTLAFVRDLVTGALFGLAIYDLSRNSVRNQLLLTQTLAISGVCVAVLGLLEAGNIDGVTTFLAGFRYQPTFSVGDVARISSTLPHPNVAAIFVGLTLPLILAWTVTTRSVWLRGGLAVAGSAMLAALVLTISRAGILVMELTLVGLLGIALWIRHPRLARAAAGGAVMLPVLIAASLVVEPTLLLRLNSETVLNWYRADYSAPETVSGRPGETVTVPVEVVNTGVRTWSASGDRPFALSYHMVQDNGTSVTYDGQRTSLPGDVHPGGAVGLQARLLAPLDPGAYVVQWDALQESVTWFSWTGAPEARTYLTVSGVPVPGDAPPAISTPPPEVLGPPPDRLSQWRIALRMARNRPLLGVGPDNFRWVYGDFAGLTRWDTGSHANSVYFEWLADTGVVGLGLFIWLLWSLARASTLGLFALRGSPAGRVAGAPDARWIWRLALSASLGIWFLHGGLDYFYEPLSTNTAFWLVAGLALAAAESARQKPADVTACASVST